MTFTTVAVVITKVLFGICNCRVDSDVGMSNYTLALGILCICGHVHVSLGMECENSSIIVRLLCQT